MSHNPSSIILHSPDSYYNSSDGLLGSSLNVSNLSNPPSSSSYQPHSTSSASNISLINNASPSPPLPLSHHPQPHPLSHSHYYRGGNLPPRYSTTPLTLTFTPANHPHSHHHHIYTDSTSLYTGPIEEPFRASGTYSSQAYLHPPLPPISRRESVSTPSSTSSPSSSSSSSTSFWYTEVAGVPMFSVIPTLIVLGSLYGVYIYYGASDALAFDKCASVDVYVLMSMLLLVITLMGTCVVGAKFSSPSCGYSLLALVVDMVMIGMFIWGLVLYLLSCSECRSTFLRLSIIAWILHLVGMVILGNIYGRCHQFRGKGRAWIVSCPCAQCVCTPSQNQDITHGQGGAGHGSMGGGHEMDVDEHEDEFAMYPHQEHMMEDGHYRADTHVPEVEIQRSLSNNTAHRTGIIKP